MWRSPIVLKSGRLANRANQTLWRWCPWYRSLARWQVRLRISSILSRTTLYWATFKWRIRLTPSMLSLTRSSLAYKKTQRLTFHWRFRIRERNWYVERDLAQHLKGKRIERWERVSIAVHLASKPPLTASTSSFSWFQRTFKTKSQQVAYRQKS